MNFNRAYSVYSLPLPKSATGDIPYIYIYTHIHNMYIYIYNYTYTLAHEHVPQTSNQATVRVQNYPSTASEVLSFEVLGASPLGDFQLARFWLPGVIKHGHL